MIRKKQLIRYIVLGILLGLVLMVQSIPAWGEVYARSVYPVIGALLSSLSHGIPFSVGDLFISLSITAIICFPFYGRYRKFSWKKVLRLEVEFLAWIYVWFYLSWGLNYSQHDFYARTQTPYVSYTPQSFKEFVKEYIVELNQAYVPVNNIDKKEIAHEITSQYRLIADSLGVNKPFKSSPRVKSMMFSWLSSAVGITGYMGPFFCEFNLNKNLLPVEYAATYAHEQAHLWGITSEAEANFYAYQVCTRSANKAIKYSGYFSVLNHVLYNAKRLLPEEDFKELAESVKPEIQAQSEGVYKHWMAMYNPAVGKMQDWIYDLYLKGNKIKSGRKNYSEVVGLLVSWREKTQIDHLRNSIINQRKDAQ